MRILYTMDDCWLAVEEPVSLHTFHYQAINQNLFSLFHGHQQHHEPTLLPISGKLDDRHAIDTFVSALPTISGIIKTGTERAAILESFAYIVVVAVLCPVCPPAAWHTMMMASAGEQLRYPE